MIKMKFVDGLKFLDELKDYVQNVHQTEILQKVELSEDVELIEDPLIFRERVKDMKIEENTKWVKPNEDFEVSEDVQNDDEKDYFETVEQSEELMENPPLMREVISKEEDIGEIDLLDLIKEEISEYGELVTFSIKISEVIKDKRKGISLIFKMRKP